MAQDLRSFLDLVKRRKPEDFRIVSKEVDPAYELTALVVKLEREAGRRPVLLFERVKGSRFPVLTNLHAGRARLAAAMGTTPEGTHARYLAAMERPIPPRIVPTGPVKEVVLTGEKIDLYALPQIVHHDGDAGPPLTPGDLVRRGPDGGDLELRLQPPDGQGAGHDVHPPHHGQAPLRVPPHRRGARRAAAGRARARRPPAHRARRAP